MPEPPKKLARWRPGSRWSPKKRPVVVLVPVMTIALIMIVVVTAFALVGAIAGRPSTLDNQCEQAAASCGVLSGLLLTLVPIAIAVVWLLVWRLDRVRRSYRREAQRHADRLLDADLPVTRIVGRDDLCDVLQDDLETVRDHGPLVGGARRGRADDARGDGDRRIRVGDQRRPVVLVGGVGVGKTAVLARLTQRLAERGAVPVPIRLRAIQESGRLDFLELARLKFLDTAEVRSEAEGDKIWRRLLENDQVVIVADGLDEALIDVEQKRETSLRRAVEKARRSGVAMIVSSRPHDALIHLDGAITKLEPLAPQAAVTHILGGRRQGDDERVRLIVERAELGEMPICMQIARELHKAGLLRVDTRGAGRLTLRVQLLRAWMTALAGGSVRSTVPVKPDDRKRAIERLQTLALIALTQDSLEVRFEVIDRVLETGMAALDDDQAFVTFPRQPRPATRARRFRRSRTSPPGNIAEDARADLRSAAADAERLGLVDALPDGLRFRHSILQAYLGSLAIRRAIQGPDDGAAGNRDPVAELLVRNVEERGLRRLGHELLLALAMSTVGSAHSEMTRSVVSRLTSLAEQSAERAPSKAVSATAAAVAAAAAAATADGSRDRPPDRRRLHDAVADFLARDVSGSRALLQSWWGDGDGHPARLDDATSRAYRSPTYEAKLTAVARFGEAAQYEWLWAICLREREYLVRTAAVRALGAGGDTAFELIGEDLRVLADVATGTVPDAAVEQLPIARAIGPPLHAQDADRLSAIACWVLPLICAAMATARGRPGRRTPENTNVSPGAAPAPDTRTASRATVLLRRWIDHACGPSSRLSIGQQIGFAQGCRDAANLRHVDARTRAMLEGQAHRLLDRTPFWYARVALIQALSLWLLATLEEEGASDRRHRRDAAARIRDWAAQEPHPFVTEAAELCVQAARTEQPAHYIWTDESAAVARLGAGPGAVRLVHDDTCWIPESAGWLSLEAPAQRLLADMVVLMNLADRGDTVAQKEQYLLKTRGTELPLCFARRRGRAHLDVERTLDEPKEPGAGCVLGCKAGLCPYPRLDEELSRGELSEAFCRKQQALASGWRAFSRPSWQKRTRREELKRFWRSMERRPRG